MDLFIEVDPSLKAVNRFYTRIRSYLDDLILLERDSVRPVCNRLQAIKEKERYGLVSFKELESMLKIYEKQSNKPVKNDQLEANSLAKILHSKSGFHNPSSTAYLVECLRINDVSRNSFLGGHSTYETKPENNLTHIKECQKRIYIREKVSIVLEKIDRLSRESRESPRADIVKLVEELICLDPSNGDALLAKARLSLAHRNIDLAIEEFSRALDNNCFDLESAKIYMSDALVEKGTELQNRNRHEEASNCFKNSLINNPSNATAQLSLEMCQREIMQRAKTPFGYRDTTKEFYQRRK